MRNISAVRRVGNDSRSSEFDAEDARGSCLGDSSPWLDVWREGTEQARRRTAEVRIDIAYGNRESERFDLYLPTHRPRNLPFAVFVHGGEWRRALRSVAGFPAKAIHRQGAAFVTVSHDPVPTIDLAGQAEQVRRAWRYLVENAARFGLDPARGHLLGHGSGAHLAALAGFDPQGTPPASMVLLSGVYDLEPVRLAGGHEYLDLDAAIAARLSPIHRVSKSVPSVLVAWGERETEAFRRQSLDFVRACKLRGLRTIQGELSGRDHFQTSLELANPNSQVLATLRSR